VGGGHALAKRNWLKPREKPGNDKKVLKDDRWKRESGTAHWADTKVRVKDEKANRKLYQPDASVN